MSRGPWSDGEEWAYQPLRRPAKGIRAQTQRGKFGTTWWAGRWLAALERLVDAGRLSRGRSYARGGQVSKLDVDGGGVRAEVWGHRPRPYKVTIRFQPLTDAQWERVVEALASKALYAARLLAGEMPEQIEEVFQAAGVSLFPDKAGDLVSNCTCPDWANPCKHVAAVFYLLGERFDADPFLTFLLRGRTKEQIAAALRARRAQAVAAEGEAGEAEEAPGRDGHDGRDARRRAGPDPLAPPDEPETVPLPDVATLDALAAFWSAPAALDEMSFTFEVPPVDALPVKLLGRPPFWPLGRPFPDAAEQVYRTIAERARRAAMDEEP